MSPCKSYCCWLFPVCSGGKPGSDCLVYRFAPFVVKKMIHQPKDYNFFGIEGLWGSRTNRDGSEQDASRIMASFGFLLP